MSTIKSKRKAVYIFLLVVVLVGATAYWAVPYVKSVVAASAATANGAQTSSDDKDTEGKKAEEEIVPVQLETVEPGMIASFLSATANLRPEREVDVVSQSEGLVEELQVEEGDSVKQGQLLCRLDDTQLQIRLKSAEQKLSQARLQLEKAKIRREKTSTQIENAQEDLQRYQQLYQEKLVSEREVAQYENRIEELLHDERVSNHETRELEHRVDELLAEIEEVRLQLSQAQIRAPFAGVIVSRHVERGQMVRRLDQLFKLANLSGLYVDVFVSERDAALVRANQPVRIQLGDRNPQTTAAQVVRVSPVVDQDTGTVKITCRLKAAGREFKPGAFVRVDIETDSRSGNVLVPKRALIEEDGKQYVFVAEKERVRRVEVERGYQSDGLTEILSGLSSGQQVVVAGQGALKDGSKIKVIETSGE